MKLKLMTIALLATTGLYADVQVASYLTNNASFPVKITVGTDADTSAPIALSARETFRDQLTLKGNTNCIKLVRVVDASGKTLRLWTPPNMCIEGISPNVFQITFDGNKLSITETKGRTSGDNYD